MALSWNEIRDRARKFSKEWEIETSEEAEAKTFWNDFFSVFGVSRRRVATFEYRVKKVDGKDGYIDLLWKGILLVEHKSKGKNLDRAHQQARDYFHGLTEPELPRYVLVSDFERFRLYDYDSDGEVTEFHIRDLHKHVRQFGFLAGYTTHSFKEEDPVNIAAAERMGKLHDALKAAGYLGHPLEVLLVRLLFCLFADDTSIFSPRQFHELILQRTNVDGSDLGLWLAQLFQVLDTPLNLRQSTLDEQLGEFPYVNGKLFSEALPLSNFNSQMRDLLIQAAELDWSKISPAIFGSLFQSVMDTKLRRNLGAHYTSEKNILKLIEPLFLEDLKNEFEKYRNDHARLRNLHKKLASLRFLDPACGCGNFLVISYRELRKLELEILKALFSKQDSLLYSVSDHVVIDVDQFYGIEIEEFPAQVAQVAMWLMDHQMNLMVSEHFGEHYARLPLSKSATIIHGNALTIAWDDVCPRARLSYLLGNPPFYGSQMMSKAQKLDLLQAASGLKNASSLDFVAGWYLKAADYIDGTNIKCGLVSTNSITQGKQAGILWPEMLHRGMVINFAHRTFAWTNEAKGNAAVHCVIIGFSQVDKGPKVIWDYEHVKSEPVSFTARNINPYLVDADNYVLQDRRSPICEAPHISFGSMPNDGGNLLLSDEERAEILAKEPELSPWIRRFVGSEEFINGINRWCLWLIDCPPPVMRLSSELAKRIAAVRTVRLDSTRPETNRLASTPFLFGEIRQPSSSYIGIPKTSSERRTYIPIGIVQEDVIANTELFTIEDWNPYIFGILTSKMHMAWVNTVCGRLKSDYRYSAGIVYNNFPWPLSPTESQTEGIANAANEVISIRGKFPNSTLADLYDPNSMPAELTRAHHKLDRAVESAYSKKQFKSDAERVSFLFLLYKHYLSPKQ